MVTDSPVPGLNLMHYDPGDLGSLHDPDHPKNAPWTCKDFSYLVGAYFSQPKTCRRYASTNQSCQEYPSGTELLNTSYLAQQRQISFIDDTCPTRGR